jgi:hypothetical protein
MGFQLSERNFVSISVVSGLRDVARFAFELQIESVWKLLLVEREVEVEGDKRP